ncbi:MAG TPA: protein phosphatase 2C domain-containing protein [Acetobacteraceae bacterium]|nr:protein phosphatase 2C domain-containing protein [Acetobacteraceae bacterium]
MSDPQHYDLPSIWSRFGNQPSDTSVIVAKLDLPREAVGEDAPPLAAGDPVRLIGVFDGLGGAGARQVSGVYGIRTCAYYASRIARQAVEETLNNGHLRWLTRPEDVARTLGAAIFEALVRKNAESPVGTGSVRSSLIRSYPTTAAMVFFDIGQADLNLTALWAGDSRCYLLTPGEGLQQLSQDDSRTGADPMEALREDSPMSSMLTADAPCHLHARTIKVGMPAILITASDGAYGCLPSPMHFERLLLESLSHAQEDDEWCEALSERLQPIANDDISLAAAFIGWKSLPEARDAFSLRLSDLSSRLSTFEEALEGSRQLEQEAHRKRELAKACLAESWSWYRQSYMSRLGGPNES